MIFAPVPIISIESSNILQKLHLGSENGYTSVLPVDIAVTLLTYVEKLYVEKLFFVTHNLPAVVFSSLLNLTLVRHISTCSVAN